jgi:heme exporter protein D
VIAVFQFESVADFFLMDGHGLYVWASYAITLLVLVLLAVSPSIQQRAFIIQQKRQQRIENGVRKKRSEPEYINENIALKILGKGIKRLAKLVNYIF